MAIRADCLALVLPVDRLGFGVRTTMRRYTLIEWVFSQAGKSRGCHGAKLFRLHFIKTHRALHMSPAMAAGGTDRLWDVTDLVALWESYEQRRAEERHNSDG